MEAMDNALATECSIVHHVLRERFANMIGGEQRDI